MNKVEIINKFIEKYKYEKYLEIGVDNGQNLKQVKCLFKDGVDPKIIVENKVINEVNYPITSDQFFKFISEKQKYDFILIDGLHETEQVDKDIQNSLKHLNDNGIIMLHDTVPPNYKVQQVPKKSDPWTGDVWKSIVKLNYNNSNINFFTIVSDFYGKYDVDWGCTILKKGNRKLKQHPPIEQALDWNYFDNNKIQLLNLITTQCFLELFEFF